MIGHITIQPDQSDQWQQCLIKGQEQNLTARMVSFSEWDDRKFYVYDVDSSSRDKKYAVSLGVKNGNVLVACSCEAGGFYRPCKHAALAVEAAGVWPFPIASQVEMFEAAS